MFQSQADLEVFLKVLDDSLELGSGERAVTPARGLVGRQDVP
jgi:hypothetical protein